MQLIDLLFALTAFALSTAALPVERRQAAEPCPEDSPQYQQLRANQTSVFAHQLVGSSLGSDEVDNTCNGFSDGCYDKWAQQGFALDNMKKTVCAARNSQPSASLALPKAVQASTKVFATQLLNTFNQDDDSTFKYLCSHLSYKQLSGFLIDDNQIIETACASGNAQMAPQPFTTAARINSSAVDHYHSLASKLYAYEYASAATTESELSQYCSQAPAYHSNWNDLQLHPEVVQDTLCSVTQPLSIDDAKAQVTQLSSEQFLTILTNISSVRGYKKWLCNNVDVDAMNNVGLDGNMIKTSICESVKPSAPAAPEGY